MAETSRFIRPLLEFLFPAASEETLQLIHFYIRKCAHFTEYGILAFFAARAFLGSRIDWLRKGRLIFALAVVLAVALTDEINQSFIASRTSSIRDVALDLFGGTVMMLFFWFFTRKRDRTINAAER